MNDKIINDRKDMKVARQRSDDLSIVDGFSMELVGLLLERTFTWCSSGAPKKLQLPKYSINQGMKTLGDAATIVSFFERTIVTRSHTFIVLIIVSLDVETVAVETGLVVTVVVGRRIPVPRRTVRRIPVSVTTVVRAIVVLTTIVVVGIAIVRGCWSQAVVILIIVIITTIRVGSEAPVRLVSRATVAAVVSVGSDCVVGAGIAVVSCSGVD